MSTFAWRRFADSRSTLARSSVASKKYTERLGDSAATPSRSIIQGRRLPGGRRNDLPTPFAFLHVDLAVASSPGRLRTSRYSFPALPTTQSHATLLQRPGRARFWASAHAAGWTARWTVQFTHLDVGALVRKNGLNH